MTQSMLANNGAEISHSLVEMSDEWLVVAAKDGNVDAFAELRARHFRTILRTTYRIADLGVPCHSSIRRSVWFELGGRSRTALCSDSPWH
jgi:hypothetical protein